MCRNLTTFCTVTLFALGIATTAYTEQRGSASNPAAVGQFLFESHCAVCHGSNGSGPGRASNSISSGRKIPDLTRISQRNDGAFPFVEVYESIDGRRELPAHGPKDTPIWGKDAFSRDGIPALVNYIYRLQVK
jgi:mono/diheme cytochrome c family protein